MLHCSQTFSRSTNEQRSDGTARWRMKSEKDESVCIWTRLIIYIETKEEEEKEQKMNCRRQKIITLLNPNPYCPLWRRQCTQWLLIKGKKKLQPLKASEITWRIGKKTMTWASGYKVAHTTHICDAFYMDTELRVLAQTNKPTKRDT